MDKFIIKSKRESTASVGSSSIPNPISNTPYGTDGGESVEKRPRLEFSENDIIGDPAFCKPIGGYHGSVRDEDRRHCLSFKSQEMETAYRSRLTAIIKVIRLLLQQCLPFRKQDLMVESLQRDHFLGLLGLSIECIPDFPNILGLNAPEKNYLTSRSTQKQIVSVCASKTLEAIVSEIGEKFFSIFINEVRDNSKKEQISVVVRYVNKFGEVVERFLGIVRVSDSTAPSLKSGIEEFFAKIGLSLSRLRGQWYSEASNLREEFNGLKTLILSENPYARYIHCFAHELQQVVVAVAEENTAVCNFLFSIPMIINLTRVWCKMRDIFQQKQPDHLVECLEKGESSSEKGKHQESTSTQSGDTHCGSYYKTIVCLLNLWHSVLEVLYDISEDKNDGKSRRIAVDLINRMESYEFVFSAHLMRDVLSITNELSQDLQHKDQNIGATINLIKTVKERLQQLRHDGWDELVGEVNNFCLKNDIRIPNMEDNVPGRVRCIRVEQPVTYFHHFRVGIFCEVIDLIAQEMDNRFNESNTELLMCVTCLCPRSSFSNFDLHKLLSLAELYPKDFSLCDQMELKQELMTFMLVVKTIESFSNLHDVEALAKEMVKVGFHNTFHLVYLLLELALVLPIATTSVERAFFTQNIIKDLRNNMEDDFITDGLICYVERDVFENIENEAILDRFQKMQSEECSCCH